MFQYLVIAEPINVNKNEENDMFQHRETLFKIDNLLLEASKTAELGDYEIALKLYDEIIKRDVYFYSKTLVHEIQGK